jgi:hypothetical protein
MKHPRRYLIVRTSAAFLVFFCSILSVCARENGKPLRAGIIGLDTSHVTAFTAAFNAPQAGEDLGGIKVVAAFPGGSSDIADSKDRIAGFTKDVQAMGVEIVDSIDDLLEKVDVVLLESVDGRTHLSQARPVITTGKPLFIDKPMAASLADAISIFKLAKENNVPCFSASSLRYSSGLQAIRNGTSKFGAIRSCTASSPMTIEPHHPDLFWYGIHGVESLFTVMGTGCETVSRIAPDKAVGIWRDGRQGTFVASENHSVEVEGTLSSGTTGAYEGYRPLLVEIANFFRTGKSPVSAEETLEILAFMEAADESKSRDGRPVAIASVMQRAAQTADNGMPK